MKFQKRTSKHEERLNRIKFLKMLVIFVCKVFILKINEFIRLLNWFTFMNIFPFFIKISLTSC